MSPASAPSVPTGGATASRALAVVALAAGVVVLAGWALNLPLLRTFYPGYVSMKPNEAVAMALVAVALLLLDRVGRARGAGAVLVSCVSAAIVVSLVTILEDLAGWDFGVDRLLFDEPVGTPGTSFPGRPSIGGMMCVLASGVAVAFTAGGKALAGQWAALVAGTLAYRSVIGYGLGVHAFLPIGRFTEMSVPGSIAFLALAGGVMAARPDRGLMALVTSRGAGGDLMRRLGPAAVLLFLMVAWMRYSGEQAHIFTSRYGASLMILAGTVALVAAVYVAARELDRADRERNESMLQLRGALDRLRSVQDKMVEQARLRTVGEMASGIAHDLNNTLAPILGYTETLLEWPRTLRNRKETLESLRAIRGAAQDAAQMVARLRRFYRPAGAEAAMKAVNLNRLATDAVVLTRPRWGSAARSEGRTVKVRTEPGNAAEVVCNAEEIREALVNLVINSVDAMPNGGTVTISTRREGDGCSIEVRDDGEGMTEEVRRRCMEPFFSTKGEAGTGLGLSMVSMTVRRHGGSVSIESEPGKGTTVSILLPPGIRAGGAVETEEAGPWKTPLRVLVVDDEPRIRNLLSGQLRRDGHRVTVAADGHAALDAFRTRPFNLVITDRVMPGMSGEEVADAVKRQSPGCPVIQITGFEAPEGEFDGVHAPPDLILRKPFSLAELRDAIRQAMSPRRT